MAERVLVALDLETTGLDPSRDTIIEIGAVRFQGDRVLDRFVTLVNPQRSIPLRITQITGIRNADVAGAPVLAAVLPELLAFVTSDVAAIVAHNAGFDLGFLRAAGVQFHRPVYDTFELAGILLPGRPSYSLGELCNSFAIPLVDAHRAVEDASATAQLLVHLQRRALTLPAATIQAIVESGPDADWAPRPFFAEIIAGQNGANDAPQPKTSAPDALGFELAPPVTEDGGPLVEVEMDELERQFGVEGPLSHLFASEFEQRVGQVEMARLVAQSLNAGDHLLVEAGTGTGKSLAYLLPAALWALANGRRVMIATNTIALQDQLIDKDIPQVQLLFAAEGKPAPRAALLKGRSHYLCLRRFAQWRANRRLSPLELTVLAKVLVWLPETRTGDVSEIFLGSPAERAIWGEISSDGAQCTLERCGSGRDFYLAARVRAETVHLLVVNHALLLADLATGGRVLPPYTHLVVDETHRLEEAATEQLTFRVEWPAFQGLVRRLAADGELTTQLRRRADQKRHQTVTAALPELANLASRAGARLEQFANRLNRFVREQESVRQEIGYVQRLALDGAVRSQPNWSQIEIDWEQVSGVLENLLAALANLVQALEAGRWPEVDPDAELYAAVQALTALLVETVQQLNTILLAPAGQRRDHVAWLEFEEQAVAALAIAPVAVNEILEEGLVRQRRCAIFTGATLRTDTGFRYIRERLGLWDVKIATVESPFDYKQSTLLYLPADMPLPNQPQYQQAVEQAVVDAVRAAQGRTLVLFTSYQQLRTTADAIRERMDRDGITVLQHGQSSRQRLLREYRNTTRAVLLGTRSFWEGIDLPGEQLSCLLIARLPFAVPNDPLVAARSAEFEDPFQDYTVPDAVIRFRQGFGRLIRRASDRGVVVVLDSRVWRKDYGQAFLDALPPCTTRRLPLRDLNSEVRRWLAAPAVQGAK